MIQLSINENLSAHGLLARGDHVLVAVSGGVDSMVLLNVMHRIAGDFGCKISMAHFNHKLRGLESDEDEAFVRRTAGAMGLPLHSGHGDVAAEAQISGVSIEMAARRLRHEFLARAARVLGATTIALAHHADDQVETFWLRLLRGNVGEGLGGMRWKSPSPADPNIQLIRPLLNIGKAAILSFAAERHIAFREDSSNSELDFQRNRIRHEIIPILERYQPNLREITLRTAEVLAAEKEFLRLKAANAEFPGASPALQREILRQQLRKTGVEPTFDLIESLRASLKPVMIAPGLLVSRDRNGVIHTEKMERAEFNAAECILSLERVGNSAWDGLIVNWEFGLFGDKQANLEQFDADAVGPEITLRHWREGDRFQPIGLSHSVKLQDLFMNAKVPEIERHRRAIATTRRGEIFWVEGLRIGENARVTPRTTRVLKWNWRR